MSSTSKAVLGVILVFIIGLAGGAFSASLYIHHKTVILMKGGPAAMAEMFERRMTRNLGLDQNQKKQIHEAFVKNLTQRTELQKAIQPQIRMLNRETLSEVNAALKPEQQKKFHDNIDEFIARSGRNPFNPGTDKAQDSIPNGAVGQPPTSR